MPFFAQSSDDTFLLTTQTGVEITKHSALAKDMVRIFHGPKRARVRYDFVKIDWGLALAHALQNLLVQKIDEMMYASPTEEKKEEEDEPSLNKNFQVQVHAVANSSSF